MGASPASCRCSGREAGLDEDDDYSFVPTSERLYRLAPGDCRPERSDTEVVVGSHPSANPVAFDDLMQMCEDNVESDIETPLPKSFKMGRPSLFASRVHQIQVFGAVCCSSMGCKS
mmetsp:Transcript_4738/g.11160  ORF Transcript_4738/g.11160 Transcript_4738/m.11160 type:complete len:116 (-) Transcript_4738:97-444(-)